MSYAYVLSFQTFATARLVDIVTKDTTGGDRDAVHAGVLKPYSLEQLIAQTCFFIYTVTSSFVHVHAHLLLLRVVRSQCNDVEIKC